MKIVVPMTFVRLLIAVVISALTNLANATQPTILVMGDSLSAGYGIKVEQSWVSLLAQDYAKHSQAKVVNASVSGETSSGGLARLPALLSLHHPNIVVIELGGNDGLRGQPLKLLEENLQAMISTSQSNGAKVLLIGMQIPTNYGARYTKQFSETFSKLADKNQISLVPFLLEGVALHDELFQNDHIHPIAEAHPIIVKNVKPILDQLINK